MHDSLFFGNSAETGAGGMLTGFIDGGGSRNSNKLVWAAIKAHGNSSGEAMYRDGQKPQNGGYNVEVLAFKRRYFTWWWILRV